MWSFHQSWFFATEFPRGTTQLYGISEGEVLLSLEFPKGIVTIQKFQSFFQKIMSSNPPTPQAPHPTRHSPFSRFFVE